MNILVVSQYFYPENFRINVICKDLINRGHEVTVLTGYPNYPKGVFYDNYCPGIPYEKMWEGIKIERVKILERKNGSINLIKNYISFIIYANRWVRKCKQNYDICFVNGLSPITVALPAIKFKKKTNTPIIMNVQDLWPESVQYMLEINCKLIIKPLDILVNYIYKKCDAILCSSKCFVDKIANRKIAINKIFYWPQFAEIIETDASAMPQKVEGEFRIVFAGNIGEAQGLDIVIKAAKILEKDYPEIKWHLIGDGRDKDRLIKIAKQESLLETVIFIDRMSEKNAFAYIKSSDCAIITLKKNKLFELTVPAKLQTYLSAGIPIINTIDGEVKNIIAEAKCGYSSAGEDAVELSKSIMLLYNNSLTEREDMGINGKKYFDENYNENELMNTLENYFKVFRKEI